MNAARDLFTDTPSDEAPAAEVQDRQRRTGRTPDREGGERLALSGAAANESSAVQEGPERGSNATVSPAGAGCCGTCSESSAWMAGMVGCAQLKPWHHISEMASCHFSPSRWRPLDSAALVKRKAQEGIDQAVGAADRAAPGWSDRALEFIRVFAEANAGRQLTGFEIVQDSIRRGFEQPKNGGQAWGSPLQRAARAGHLVRRGSVPDPNPERHRSDVPLWECA